MPSMCCVVGCRMYYNKTNGVSFHRFPEQETMREIWLNAIGLETVKWDATRRVCSRHFTKDDFIIGGNRKKLKKCAIPNPKLVSDSALGDTLRIASSRKIQPIPTGSSATSKDTWKQMEQYISVDPILVQETIKFESTDTECSIPKVCKKEVKASDDTKCMIWMPEENEDSSPIKEEIQSPMLQISTNQNILVNATKAETYKCSCSATISKLENEIAYLQEQNNILQNSIRPKAVFGLEAFASEDNKILYYTGFHSYQLLSAVFEKILPSGDVKDIAIYAPAEKMVMQDLNKLSPKEQFFVTLMRLRRGIEVEILADMFSISKTTVDNIFLCWINAMYVRLSSPSIWSNRDVLINRASENMKAKYKNVIGSICCTELVIERPSSLQKQSHNSTAYTGSTILKSLILIEAGGAIIYASPLFTGPISDKEIIESSGFLEICKEKVDKGQILPGDVILANKEFNVADLFKSISMNVNIPVFRINCTEFTAEEVVITRKIALERIHVEHAIDKLKSYKILSTIPISSLASIEHIYAVCVLLCNFRYGLLQETNNILE